MTTNHDDLRKLAEAADAVTPGQRTSWLAEIEFLQAMSPEVTLGLLDDLKDAKAQVAQLRNAFETITITTRVEGYGEYGDTATEPKAKEDADVNTARS